MGSTALEEPRQHRPIARALLGGWGCPGEESSRMRTKNATICHWMGVMPARMQTCSSPRLGGKGRRNVSDRSLPLDTHSFSTRLFFFEDVAVEEEVHLPASRTASEKSCGRRMLKPLRTRIALPFDMRQARKRNFTKLFQVKK